MVAMYDDEIAGNPKTLCDWVKNFRIKKIQMKRKLRSGGDLRVCAILSTALISAEHELRRKQQERFNRWLEMQAKLDGKWEHGAYSGNVSSNDRISADDAAPNACAAAADECRQRDITNLWKYELSGLDEFMRSMSSSSGGDSMNNTKSSIGITVAS